MRIKVIERLPGEQISEEEFCMEFDSGCDLRLTLGEMKELEYLIRRFRERYDIMPQEVAVGGTE